MEKSKGPPPGGKTLTMEDMPSIVVAVVKAMKEAPIMDNEDDMPSDETPPGSVLFYFKYNIYVRGSHKRVVYMYVKCRPNNPLEMVGK